MATPSQAAAFRPQLSIAGERTRLLVDQIRSVDTRYVGSDPVDFLSPDDMARVEFTIARYLGVAR